MEGEGKEARMLNLNDELLSRWAGAYRSTQSAIDIHTARSRI